MEKKEVKITVADLRFLRAVLVKILDMPMGSTPIDDIARCLKMADALDAVAEGLCHDDYLAVTDGVTTLEHG